MPTPYNLKLLVSYENTAELVASAGCFPDWIDLKNPDRGSLGCPAVETAEAFLQAARAISEISEKPLSIAVGELRDKTWLGMVEVIAGFDFAKVGLANCDDYAPWSQSVQDLAQELKLPGHLILCHYADRHRANSPPWEQVLEASQRIRSPYILIDTYDKQAGRIWDWCTDRELRTMRDSASEVGIQLALAGSLRLDEFVRAAKLGVDVVGLRGAVCKFGSRVETLCRDRLSEASEAILRLLSSMT